MNSRKYAACRNIAPVKYTHRIRPCRGDKSAWLLAALHDDGTEIDSYVTANSIDALLERSRGLLPTENDVVQIIYYFEAVT